MARVCLERGIDLLITSLHQYSLNCSFFMPLKNITVGQKDATYSQRSDGVYGQLIYLFVAHLCL
jgi:hypothetical protein